MSSSLPCNIPYMLELVAKNIFSKVDPSKMNLNDMMEGKPFPLQKFKILDVGCGFGKWGFLIRDTFEVMLAQNFNKPQWKIELTAVESFDKCITPIQEGIYNKILKKDIFDAMTELEKYDLIIMGDVIEHFEKEKAYVLLDKLLEHSENILISTPLGFLPQGAWAGNEKEIHRSGWTLNDFKKYTIVEHKLLNDTLFSDILKNMVALPKDLNPEVKLIVLWIKK